MKVIEITIQDEPRILMGKGTELKVLNTRY